VLNVPVDLPGHELVGFDVPEGGAERPSHRLYELLSSETDQGAHSRYNALVARIVSFARAAEHASSG